MSRRRAQTGPFEGVSARALAGSVARLFKSRARRVAVGKTKGHVELKELSAEVLDRVALELERLGELVQRFDWIDVNRDTRRVVFSFEPDGCSPEELDALVEQAERAAGAGGASFAEDGRAHPADTHHALRHLVELAADSASFVLALALRISPLPTMPFAGNLAAVISVLQSSPGLREGIEQRLGKERGEFLLNLASSFAQVAAHRPFNALVDALHKLSLLREAHAQQKVWEARGETLCREPSRAAASEPLERPTDLPQGPIEDYADSAWFVSLGGFALSFLTTRSFQRATAALFGGLPRPARLGREAFAAELSLSLAERGVLVLDREVLRRLDRVDCLVLHGDLVSRQEFVIGAVSAEDADDNAEARLHAARLFDPKRPLEGQSDGLWRLGPWNLSSATADATLTRRADERGLSGALVLSLERAGRVVAVVEVEILARTGVEEIISAAHNAQMRVVIASAREDVLQDLNADDVISHGEGLAAGIRRLQLEGHGVCLVAAGTCPELRAADCGVGLCSEDAPTPWGAHILVRDELSEVHFIVESCATARRVSKDSVNIALGAASVGAVVSAGGLLKLTHRRVMAVVNFATLVSMANGVRISRSLTERALPPPRDPTPWHALDPRGVLARLGTSQEGLLPSEVLRRTGELTRGPEWGTVSLREAITDELFSPLAPLLAAGAGLSAVVGSFADAGMVGAVIGLNALVGGVQRYRTERRISRLSRQPDLFATVRRHGRESVVDARELVVGDVVVFRAGDIVPADCRIIESTSLEVDASSITGESLPVGKNAEPSFEAHIADRSSMLYSGTTVAAGRAFAVVVATGEATLARHGMGQAKNTRTRGGVEQRLRGLMDLTGPIALAAGVGVVGGGLLRGRKLEDLVGSGVSLAVASVPEGLPVLATAAQLSAAERLSQRGALVRNPRSIEAIGRVNVLCLDKTGTLTRGEIELSEVHAGELGSGLAAALGDGGVFGLAERAVIAVGVRATASAERRLGGADPTDEALWRAAAEHGVAAADGADGWQRMSEIGFAPGRGYHATLAWCSAGPRLSVKGAPESVLARSQHVRTTRGSVPLDDGARRRLSAVLDRLTRRGLRVLCVAERTLPAVEPLEARHVEQLELCGFLAFRDPVRPSAKQAIAGIRKAGVRALMVTGDHPNTAEAIALELDLLEGRSIMTGGELGAMSDEDLDREIGRVGVFARVTPSQKVRVVRALQRTGHVVGMVGDGANDAPAIRLADCGIAVGEHGTAAARAAADVVLRDGRIETLLDAIVEGRAMWASVRDAVSILMGGNLGEIGFTLAAGLLDGRPPLHARQLLLVNLLTDVAPAMAIALRPPTPASLASLASEGPDAVMGKPLNRQIAVRALATGVGAGSAWAFARLTGSEAKARTVALAALVGSQLGQTLRSGGMTRPVIATSLLSSAALVGIIQTPGVSHFFGCRPLGPIGWATAVGASFLATNVASATSNWWQREVVPLLLNAGPPDDELGLLPAVTQRPEKIRVDVG
jgi:cation-transporting ATPase I